MPGPWEKYASTSTEEGPWTKYGGQSTQDPTPTPTDSGQQQQGFWSKAGDIASDVGEGALKGAASTIFHGGDLIRRGLGMERVINRPEVQQGITPVGTAQKVGSGIEQAAEFLIPGGAISKGTKAIEATTAASRAAPVARVLGRAVLEAAGAGGVAGAQTGGDPAAMRNAALAAGGTSAVIGGIGAALPSKQATAERLYQSALKPPPSMEQAERQAIVRTGLREGLPLNHDVVANAQQRIDALNKQITKEIQARSAAGAMVDPETVAAYTNRSAQRFANQVNPEADLAAVQSAKNEFLRTQSVEAPFTKIRPGTDEAAGTFVPEGQGSTQVPQPIPLEEAQQLKQGTYRKLKDSYGEQASASREAQKDLARGLKDQIVKAFPEIASLNARESSLLALEGALNRFVGREGNKQLIGLGTPMTAVAAHAIGLPAGPLALLKAALEFPAVKSRLAIALARSAASPGAGTAAAQGVASALPKAAAYATVPNRQQTAMPPPPQ